MRSIKICVDCGHDAHTEMPCPALNCKCAETVDFVWQARTELKRDDPGHYQRKPNKETESLFWWIGDEEAKKRICTLPEFRLSESSQTDRK